MSHCPSCGRYVGPYEACPHCGARLNGRTAVRAVKVAAVTLATLGLVALWSIAMRTEVPLIQIGQAGATMNMAYVRLQGRCIRAPTYDPQGGYLGFWIADATGEIHVSAYRAEAHKIIARGSVPALGDQVEVAGTLRVREDFRSLTINLPEQVLVTRAQPTDRDIGSIGTDDQYLRVRLRGQVRGVREPYQGLTLVTIRDQTGSIPVAVSEDLIALSGVTPTLSTGQSVEVTAAVSLYGNAPQLVPASTAGIVPLSQPVPVAAERHIGQLSVADVGQLARVRGAVTEVNPFSAGVKFTLDDASGAVTVLLWQSVFDGLPDPAALEVGTEVQVQGEVSEYRGALEVVPEFAGDVRVLAPAPPPAEASAGALSATDVARVVKLHGTLGRPEPFSAGVKFPLDDGTGQLTLLLWSSVYEQVTSSLVEGAQVEVTGQVNAYRGELEIIPRNAAEIVLLEQPPAQTPPTPQSPPPAPTYAPDAPAPTPTPAPGATPAQEATPAPEVELTPIAAITANRVGERVTVEGTIAEAVSFSAGFTFTLDDGTGQIALVMWHDVYDDCWDASQINLGAQVRATGEVTQYEGRLQIQPRFGGDVKAMEGAQAWATPRELGSLTGDDDGQRAMIEGQVIRVESLRDAVKVFVNDGTGEIVVFVWRTVLNRIPGNTALGTPGSRVRVVGAVELYKGNLEIVPTLPHDVTVLETP